MFTPVGDESRQNIGLLAGPLQAERYEAGEPEPRFACVGTAKGAMGTISASS